MKNKKLIEIPDGQCIDWISEAYSEQPSIIRVADYGTRPVCKIIPENIETTYQTWELFYVVYDKDDKEISRWLAKTMHVAYKPIANKEEQK